MTQEALKLALEALEPFTTPNWAGSGVDKCNEAITAIKAALAQPEQEPVAWVCYGSSDSKMHDIDFEQIDVDALPVGTMLYTHPPQRTEQEPTAKYSDIVSDGGFDPRNKFDAQPQRTEPAIDKSAAIRIATALGWTPPHTWVGLTDDEIWEAYMESPVELNCPTFDLYAFSRTIENKVKEKNT